MKVFINSLTSDWHEVTSIGSSTPEYEMTGARAEFVVYGNGGSQAHGVYTLTPEDFKQYRDFCARIAVRVGDTFIDKPPPPAN